MRARDEAFYAVDPAQWGKYTASGFTTVQQNGRLYGRADRTDNLQTQQRRPWVPREHEQYEVQDSLAVARFFSGGLWVMEVWKRVDGQWATVMTQATTAATTPP